MFAGQILSMFFLLLFGAKFSSIFNLDIFREKILVIQKIHMLSLENAMMTERAHITSLKCIAHKTFY